MLISDYLIKKGRQCWIKCVMVLSVSVCGSLCSPHAGRSVSESGPAEPLHRTHSGFISGNVNTETLEEESAIPDTHPGRGV